jgi:hypothetical protein
LITLKFRNYSPGLRFRRVVNLLIYPIKKGKNERGASLLSFLGKGLFPKSLKSGFVKEKAKVIRELLEEIRGFSRGPRRI